MSDAIQQGLYRRICQVSRPQIPWTQEGESAWIDGLREAYGDAYGEECCGFVSLAC